MTFVDYQKHSLWSMLFVLLFLIRNINLWLIRNLFYFLHDCVKIFFTKSQVQLPLVPVVTTCIYFHSNRVWKIKLAMVPLPRNLELLIKVSDYCFSPKLYHCFIYSGKSLISFARRFSKFFANKCFNMVLANFSLWGSVFYYLNSTGR